MVFYAAFLVGFLGGLHCAGMCGPIAIALPANFENKISFLLGRIFYNFGRIISYGIIGALFGAFGSQFVIWGFQRDLSIAIGVLILLIILLPRKFRMSISKFSIINYPVTKLKSAFAKLLSKNSNNSLFAIGFFNGFLPCGLVYTALAGAIAMGSAIEGSIFMMLFGLGTIPVMLTISFFGKLINVNARRKINKLISVFAIVFALIFILRGMNLDIPYLSPKMTNSTEVNCH